MSEGFGRRGCSHCEGTGQVQGRGRMLNCWCVEHEVHPPDLQGEALIRCNAALDVLRKYRNSEG